MNSLKRTGIYLLIFFIICNLPPFTGILHSIFVDMKGNQFGFVTRDLHFCMPGGIEIISNTESYKDYKIKYPSSDQRLYRVDEKDYRFFWRYGEYLTNPNWRAPYSTLPVGFNYERYYGDAMDDFPPYRWNEKTEKWERVIYR